MGSCEEVYRGLLRETKVRFVGEVTVQIFHAKVARSRVLPFNYVPCGFKRGCSFMAISGLIPVVAFESVNERCFCSKKLLPLFHNCLAKNALFSSVSHSFPLFLNSSSDHNPL